MFSADDNDLDVYIEKFDIFKKIQYDTALVQMNTSKALYEKVYSVVNDSTNKDIAHRLEFVDKLTKQANDLQQKSFDNFDKAMALDAMLDKLQEVQQKINQN